jgi:carboxylate-amine ligase
MAFTDMAAAAFSRTLSRLRNPLGGAHKSKESEIHFNPSKELTLGVEIELQLIDPTNFKLTPRAEELLKECAANPKIKPEFYLSTVEINTGICNNVQEAEADLAESTRFLDETAKRLGIALATTGSHAIARYADCIISSSERYDELIDRNQWLTRRMTVYGLHIHMGMLSGDDCIRFNNFFIRLLPHLLALSASSPFWQGDDTGLSSCRPTTYEALPTAGQPYAVRNWAEFETLYHTLKRCDAIRTLKDLWWDIRPSPGYGTLEIRVCDGLATRAETLAIVAFVHALAHWFRDHGDWIEQVPLPPVWIMRENKWRAIRHGLNAQLVANGSGDLKPLRTDIEEWLSKLSPYIARLGYGHYIRTLHDILSQGNSTERQRAVFAATGSLEAVVAQTIEEHACGVPSWPAAQAKMVG